MFGISRLSATTVRRGVAVTHRYTLARGFSSTSPVGGDQYDVVVIGKILQYGSYVSFSNDDAQFTN
jgi:hypothetical protein